MLFFKQKNFLSTNIFFHNNMNGTVFLMNIAGRLLLLRKSCVFLLLSLCLSCRVKAIKLKGKHWNIQKITKFFLEYNKILFISSINYR